MEKFSWIRFKDEAVCVKCEKDEISDFFESMSSEGFNMIIPKDVLISKWDNNTCYACSTLNIIMPCDINKCIEEKAFIVDWKIAKKEASAFKIIYTALKKVQAKKAVMHFNNSSELLNFINICKDYSLKVFTIGDDQHKKFDDDLFFQTYGETMIVCNKNMVEDVEIIQYQLLLIEVNNILNNCDGNTIEKPDNQTDGKSESEGFSLKNNTIVELASGDRCILIEGYLQCLNKNYVISMKNYNNDFTSKYAHAFNINKIFKIKSFDRPIADIIKKIDKVGELIFTRDEKIVLSIDDIKNN